MDLELLVKQIVDKSFPPLARAQIPHRGEYHSSTNSHDRDNACECDGTRLFYFLKQLSLHGLYPVTLALEIKGFTALRSALDACEFSVPRALQNQGVFECATCQPRLLTQSKIMKGKMANSFDGLCLDCVKHGPADSGKDGRLGKCRIAHSGFLGLKKED